MKAKKPGGIWTSVLGWFGLSAVEGGSLGGVESPAGSMVSERTMLSLSAVWACSRLISETIATLPLSMYEKTRDGKRPAPQHPLHFIIHDQPNVDAISAVFWEAVVAAMLLRGAARCEKLMVGDRLVGLAFLYPGRLSITRRGDGVKEYRYTDDDGRQRQIPASRIWTIPGWSLDGKNGVSVIQYGASVFGTALAAENASAGFFKRGLMPATWFKYPKVMRADQREEAREFIEGRASGAVNSGRPLILEADMEVGQLGINPAEAQLLQARGYSVEEICRWFRTPPWMIGHTEKSTSWGSGIEQQMIGFLTFTLGPWLRRIEQSIMKDLLTPVDRLRFYPKFAVEGLLRADSAARSAFYGVMVDKGIFTRDEVRELEDRQPMGGNAAVLTVQTAMAPLDSIGQAGAGQTARDAMRDWLKEDSDASE